MITTTLFGLRRRLGRLVGRKPRVVAAFSFRYDAHLVPDLIENLRPAVDGYAAFDDRQATELFSDEPARRRALVAAARGMGARWVLFVDPDERHEAALAERMRKLTAVKKPVVWGFNYRELYTPDSYRVDGLWGKKQRYSLFPLRDGGYKRKLTGLNIYHLRPIIRERRLARRDLYKRLDPEGAYQAVGYDYLAEEDGLALEPIPDGRGYRPAHKEDGRLWAGALDADPPS
ncbi:MAG: hypothetical protein J0H08_09520 [Rhizobiales bacterium]|nr:hypothetical protein [Hyphomicrobiales bacterium]